MKLWGGRFTESTDALVEAYTASISFDQNLALYDVRGSIAHARMLGDTGIIEPREARTIILGLEEIAEAVKAGDVLFRVEDEDIHMNIERELYKRIGAVAGKLHTGRSRNDQVALDLHLYVRDVCTELVGIVRELQGTLVERAEETMDIIIPGYTHLQRAQPVRMSHHLLAYFWMLGRDVERFLHVQEATKALPLGAGALAGTTFPIDRRQVADELEFDTLYENSLDAVSNRDLVLDFLHAASVCMMHLSRLSEELILWSSEEFGFIELADAYCTGSSIMPQKKNPDVPELVRGKTGRVYGHLLGLLTVLKGLPLAYNKDLQEDKEGLFDTVNTLFPALKLYIGMMKTMRFKEARIASHIKHDFSNATDLADYLVRRGIPFREAHEIVGKLVLLCIQEGIGLLELPIDKYREVSPLIEDDVYELLTPESVVEARISRGGTSKKAVLLQLQRAKENLGI